MGTREISLADAVEFIVDNRGKSVPIQENGFPLIATNCISNKNLYPEFINVRYVAEDIYRNWFRSHPVSGDIILTNKGSKNGAICMVPEPVDFCIAQDMVALRANKAKVYPHYLFAVLRSDLVQNRIKNLNVDSVIPHFKKTDFNKLMLPLPEYQRQVEIGDNYFSFCQKIELNKQTNQTLEQMAQALFKSWFVDFDPVIDNALAAGNPIPDELQARAELRQRVIAERATNPKLKPLPDDIQQTFPSEFEESELGWIPKGWESLSVHDLVDSVSITYKLKEVDKVIFLNTGDIKDGKLLHKSYSKTEGLPGQAKKSIEKGDILYSEIRPKNKRFALVNIDCSDYVVSTKLMVLRAKVGIDSLLPYFILTQEKTIQNLQHVAEHRSGTFPQITFKELADVTATLPKANTLVDYFVFNYLKPFYDKQFSSVTQNDLLEKLRDTLLPKLISGELQTPVKTVNNRVIV
jgi:type I restriction enzyme S subunit